jgi:hypothetical protein
MIKEEIIDYLNSIYHFRYVSYNLSYPCRVCRIIVDKTVLVNRVPNSHQGLSLLLYSRSEEDRNDGFCSFNCLAEYLESRQSEWLEAITK